MVDRLYAGSAPEVTWRAENLEGLPAPVERYLRKALPDQPMPDQPMPNQPRPAAGAPGDGGTAPGRLRIEHHGDFRMKPGGPWAPFRSVQHVTLDPPGFVWDARIRLAPGLTVRVRDGLVHGVGSMHAALLGLVPVADQAGTAAMATGALSRWLAEAAWFPAALVPRGGKGGPGVSWEPIDDRRARATLTHSPLPVSLDVRFDEHHQLVEVFSPDRPRDVGGTPVPTPWRGRFRTHRPTPAGLVPTEGEVEWELAEGPYAYWRGRIVAIAQR